MAKLSSGQKKHQENPLKTLSLSNSLLDSEGNRSNYGMGESNATQRTGDRTGSLLRCWILCDCLGALFAFSLTAMPATAQVSLPLPQVSLPAASVSLPAASVSLPAASVSLPAASVSLPAASVSLPAASVSLPAASVSLPAASVSLPAASVSLPAASVSLPAASVSLPAASVSLPAASVSLPAASVSLPAASVSLPAASVSLPAASVSLPAASASLPGVQVSLPAASVSLSGVQVSLPGVQVSLPGTQVNLQTVSNQLQNVNVLSNQIINQTGTVNLQPNQLLPVLEPSVNSNPLSESILTSQPQPIQPTQLPQTMQSSLPTQSNPSLSQTQVLLKINGSVAFDPSQLNPIEAGSPNSAFNPIEAGSPSSKFQPPNVQLIDPLHDSIDSANQMAQTCSVRQHGNSFVSTGRGGVTPDPTEALNQTVVWQRENSSQQAENTSLVPRYAQREDVPQVSSLLVEATVFRQNADGSISLIAEPEVARSLNTVQARRLSSAEEAKNDAKPK